MAEPAHTFDVFISYRWVEPDQSWVRDSLVPALKSAGLNVCLDVEDFVPGRDLILEMNRAGTESRHALCILSPDYFNGNRMVGFESLMARRADPSGRDSKLIPLIYRKVDLPEWLRGLVPIDWTESKHRSREWRKLLKTLAARVPDAPEPGSADHRAEAKSEVPGSPSVVEKCRALAEMFQPGTDNFDSRGWLRDVDSITLGIWHHAGLPETGALAAVLDLWQLAITSPRARSSEPERLSASVGNWRMAECLFTGPGERTIRILRALGLAEDAPAQDLRGLVRQIDLLASYLRETLLSAADGAFLCSRLGAIYDEAINHLEAVFGPADPSIGLMLANSAICATYSNFSDAHAHRLLDRAVDIGDGMRDERHDRVLLAVAQVRSSLKTFSVRGGSLVPDSSRATARRLALALSRSASATPPAETEDRKSSLLLNLLNELGELESDMGDTAEADKHFEQAHRLAAQFRVSDQETVRPVIGLMDTLTRKNEIEQAHEFLRTIPSDIPLEPRIRQRLSLAEVILQMRYSEHKGRKFEEGTKNRLKMLGSKLKEEA